MADLGINAMPPWPQQQMELLASLPKPPLYGRSVGFVVGEVSGAMHKLSLVCSSSGPFLWRADLLGDRIGWYANTTGVVGESLMRYSTTLCAAGGKAAPPTHEECGDAGHMYSDTKWSGMQELVRNDDCLERRHRRAYGELGLPRASLLPPPRIGHLQPFGYQGQPTARVREVQGCDAEAMHEHIWTHRPLVMRGCVRENSPRALEWSNEYLTRVAGDHTAPFCEKPLRDYLAGLGGHSPSPGGHNAPQGGKVPGTRNCAELPDVLLRDLSLPDPLRRSPHLTNFDKAVLWFAYRHISPLHHDPNFNFMHLLDGRKHLVLVDPADSVMLYADFAQRATGNTPIDPLAVDLDLHPLVSQATLWPLDLQTGDVLLIPSGWWHIVTSFASADSGRNVAVTMQFSEYSVGGGKPFSLTRGADYLRAATAEPPARVPPAEGESEPATVWEAEVRLERRSAAPLGEGGAAWA